MRCVFVVTVLLALVAGEAHAQPRKEALVDRVKKSIDRGVQFLRSNQRNDGSWEVNVASVHHEGGWTALAVLAMLNAGVPASDPAVQRGLNYLRNFDAQVTYVRALQTMVFAEAGQVEDAERTQKNVKWLVDKRVLNGNVLTGWGYGNVDSRVTDNSNSQYALLGLWAGRQAGVKIDRAIWTEIRDFYVRTQLADGSWKYSERGEPSLTMTSAGVCSLIIASMELNAGREIIQPNGVATNCGRYEEDSPVARGLSWISSPRRDRLHYEGVYATFYNIYGIERLGRLSGQRFLGEHDWYREGCQYLVTNQKIDGSWSARSMWDQWPVVSTSFALLFLSKGRTPVLVSKLVHTDLPTRPAEDTDWNNDRNDLANLVAFSSKELFKKLPLGWQNFDMLRAATPKGNRIVPNEDDLLEATSDLLQAPIAYFNGHKSPLRRFTGVEKEVLKRYVDNGGFLVVEACCGSPDFDTGFKALAAELWPDDPLELLDAEHAVWRSFFVVPPGQPYKLMGINRACKTVLVYAPQDMSCQWEGNNFDKNAAGKMAFQLGANIVAYATGMEPPRPKLTHVELASTKEEPSKLPRGYFKVGQLKYRGGDWQPAPRAMSNLMDYLRTHAGLDVALKTRDLTLASETVIDYKFLYMHGRGEITFNADQLKPLRFNLETGGLLFADACCGKPTFDKDFRKFVKALFPEHKLQEVPLDDPLFGKELNGVKLDEQTIQCRRELGGPMRNLAPLLEGIKIDNRWVVLYSKYDIGCALERHKASDCLGYEPESAKRIAGAAVLYLLNFSP